ncbi:MAG: hypothetical protein ACJ8GW_01170, partial [Massilia sp.]
LERGHLSPTHRQHPVFLIGALGVPRPIAKSRDGRGKPKKSVMIRGKTPSVSITQRLRTNNDIPYAQWEVLRFAGTNYLRKTGNACNNSFLALLQQP